MDQELRDKITTLKAEAVALRAAGDKHGALAKVREMRALQQPKEEKPRPAEAAAATEDAPPETVPAPEAPPEMPPPPPPPPPPAGPSAAPESGTDGNDSARAPSPPSDSAASSPSEPPPPPQSELPPPPPPPPCEAKSLPPPSGGRCAPLIQWVDGEWRIHPAGAALLNSVTSPLCVVACAGLYRTGKSFLLNAIAGQLGARAATGFRVGSTSESCTRGIDVCVPAAAADDGDGNSDSASMSTQTTPCGGTLVLLDSEGIASMDQDETYDAQIFSLALLVRRAPRGSKATRQPPAAAAAARCGP